MYFHLTTNLTGAGRDRYIRNSRKTSVKIGVFERTRSALEEEKKKFTVIGIF